MILDLFPKLIQAQIILGHLEKLQDRLISSRLDLCYVIKITCFPWASGDSGTKNKELQSSKKRSLFYSVLLNRFHGNYSALCLIKATAKSAKAMLDARELTH